MSNSAAQLISSVAAVLLFHTLQIDALAATAAETRRAATTPAIDAHLNLVNAPVLSSCPSTALIADVVAIDHPMVFNRLGAQNVNWMMYALRHDVIDLKSKRPLDYTPEGEKRFLQARANNKNRNIALRPDLRPRPLVLRVAAGGYLKVNFTNLLEVTGTTAGVLFDSHANPFNSEPNPLPGIDHPVEHAAKDPAGTPTGDTLFHIDDQVASRTVGFHPTGLELVGSIKSDSSYVGKNPSSLATPGQTRTYCFHAPKEGAFLVSSDGAVFGGEGSAGNSGVGLFGAVAVQPKGAKFYRAQVTEEELRLATRKISGMPQKTPDGHPVIDYEAKYPNDCATNGVWCSEGKAGRSILNMVQNRHIVHGDINAIVIGPDKDGSFPASTYPVEGKKNHKGNLNKFPTQNPSLPNRLEPFREFVSIFHDENAATQAYPYFFEHPELGHTLHGVRDAFMINYGSGGIGAEIIANRLKAGPMQDCVDCAYEEFFLSSFVVGDAAMLVDKPANLSTGLCQPEYLPKKNKAGEMVSAYPEKFNQYCIQPEQAKAQKTYYPHDPANVNHSYIGDFVKFRNVHAGKEQHIFHLHNHQWLFNPNDDNSNYIDAQGIGPASGYTYEIAFGGSGNRNKTVGDAIYHCHFYPHFAQGMWYMWRNHDVFEAGTKLKISENRTGFHTRPFDLMDGQPASKARALPDGEIVAGTPIPAVVPLPGKALAPMPAKVVVKPRMVAGKAVGSVAKTLSAKGNPGYPFWIAGAETSVGSRPTTPPLDMAASAGGFDGGLPRHALLGYSSGSESESKLSRFSAEKHIMLAKPEYYPETGTPLENRAMKFHAQRQHDSYSVTPGGLVSPAKFITNGAKPTPGAPYNDPCIDDQGKALVTGQDAKFFGGVRDSWIGVNDVLPGGVQFGGDQPRIYKGANIQLDVVFNKQGYHYPQQRILSLWEDVDRFLPPVKAGVVQTAPEPLVLRMNTFDCAMYQHTNLIPKEFFLDDYQITTPTDVIGQHIHLPKWDLTSADGSANGWNYEDGTFSPGAVRERIHAINAWNHKQALSGSATVANPYDGSNTPLVPKPHPYFSTLQGRQKKDCVDLWNAAPDLEMFEHAEGYPGACDWLGARTTLQRWFSDPIINTQGIHRGLGITFTHDHLGPSTHQQLGLYATMLTEPPGSEWRHNETGTKLYTRADGGPTSWQALITGKNNSALDVDLDERDDSHREFFLQFGDFQHAYLKDHYYGVSKEGKPYTIDPTVTVTKDSFRVAIHPSVRKPANPNFPDIVSFSATCPGGKSASRLPGAVYNSIAEPDRPCPEAISADDVGMMVVNYRNEPIAARVYDPSRNLASGSGGQTAGDAGDLSFAMQTRTDRAINQLNTPLGDTPYSALTSGIAAGDPFTPILRAYSGDFVRVKVQAGSHEHEHNGTVNGIAWTQAGSGFGQAPHSGWRNAQNAGLSEQFTFSTRITDYGNRNHLNDRMYSVDSSQDGLWNGVWGVLRTANRRNASTDQLSTLPSNPVPTLLTPYQGAGGTNDCPKNSKIRRYRVSAVLANDALENAINATIPEASENAHLKSDGGTLVYNPRATTLSIQYEAAGVLHNKTFGTGPLHDPTAIMLVRSEDLNTEGKIKNNRPVEPLVLRAAAGECVQVILKNRLPRDRQMMPDLDGYAALTAVQIRNSNAANSSMTSFNNNLIRPSNRIGLHPQLLHYDVQEYDGNVIGVNNISTIAPGETKVYQWYAGAVETVGSAELCPTDTKDLDAAYQLLNSFTRQINLRSLTKLTTDDSFRYDALNIVDTRLDAAVSSNDKTDIVNEIARVTADMKCLDTIPDGRRLNTDAISKSGIEDEAPLLSTEAYFDRIHIFKNRQRCTTELIQPYTEVLKKYQLIPDTETELATELARLIAFEGDTVSASGKESTQVSDQNQLSRRLQSISDRILQFIGLQNPPEKLADANDEYFELDRSSTRLASLHDACRYVAIEYGATNITPPDRIKQGQKGAVGALIVEPENSKWKEYTDDTSLDRQLPHSLPQNKTQATRATATVTYPIKQDGTTSRKEFRDLVIVNQKGLNLRYGDSGDAITNLSAETENASDVDPARSTPEDAHDAGHMAVNYGAEPLWYRFGMAADAPFGAEGFAGIESAWQGFSNHCCLNSGTASTASPPITGDPYVPIMLASAGGEMRVRNLLPTGSGRATIFTLHGHTWPRDPYLAENVDSDGHPVGGKPGTWGTASKCIGNNPLSMSLGGQESITPMAHYDFVFASAGGKHEILGDYLWRDQAGFSITNGIWGIIRVGKRARNDGLLRHNCN